MPLAPPADLSRPSAGPSRSRAPSTSTSNTPSSTLRAPPSLRTRFNRTPRKPSTPSLSLVFAHGDASITPAGAGGSGSGGRYGSGNGSGTGNGSGSKSPIGGGSASEVALNMHLVNDSGGTRMGLRSRTGSEATVGSGYSRASFGGSGTGRGVSGDANMDSGTSTGAGSVGAGPSRSRLGSPLEGDEEGGTAGSSAAGPSRISRSQIRPTEPEGLSASPTTYISSNGLHPTLSRSSANTALAPHPHPHPHPGTSSAADSSSIRSGHTINPKRSSSWLRWNSPAPHFPRSRAASVLQSQSQSRAESTSGKGKERAREDGGEGEGVVEAGGMESGDGRCAGVGTRAGRDASMMAGTGRSTVVRDHDAQLAAQSEAEPPPIRSPITASGLASAGGEAPSKSDPQTLKGGTAAGTIRRTGWRALIWGSGMPIPDSQHVSAIPAESSIPPSLSDAPQQQVQEVAALRSSEEGVSSGESPEKGSAEVRMDALKAGTKGGIPKAAAGPASDPSGPPTTMTGGDTDSRDQTLAAHIATAETTDADRVAVPAAPQAVGWGGYLYSYISRTSSAPPAIAPSQPGTTSADRPQDATDGTTLQHEPAKPTGKDGQAGVAIKVDPTKDQPPASSPSPLPLADPDPDHKHTPKPSPDLPKVDPLPAPSTQPSTPQAQGWLSFLARRAAQRGIKASSSLDGRKSEDDVGETMDMSEDPNFPGDSEAGGVDGQGSQSGQIEQSAAQGQGPTVADVLSGEAKAVAGVPTMNTFGAVSGSGPVTMSKATGGMVIRNKRLSISSGRSGSGSSPLATSPRAAPPNPSQLANGSTAASAGTATKFGSSASSSHTLQPLEPARPNGTALTPSSLAPTADPVKSSGKASPASSVRSMPAAIPSVQASPPRPSTSGKMPPPGLPVKVPNVITPSFDTAFNRPPRSLLPLDEEEASAAEAGPARGQGGKMGKGTGTGQADGQGTMGKLAWRALSAASSYVYGPADSQGTGAKGTATNSGQSIGSRTTSTSPKTGLASLQDTPNVEAPTPNPTPLPETRGLHAGRTIGADLPRLIGLRQEAPDEGYKHVRRIVVVGVHGWFPAKMLNSVIGEPTGTSVKFASMMAAAVKAFMRDKGVGEDELRVTSMPLEGEGTIEHRVDKLYKAYLSNPAWINDLRRADAIFFAAHSQGCIVTTHLISRMIAQGHIRTPHNADAVSRCEWAFGPIGIVPSPPTSRLTTVPLKGPASPSASRSAPNPLAEVPGSEGGYQKVCLLDMCGVHLGPLYSISTSSVIQPYLQWFENAAARELFEFQDSASAVSKEYTKALGMVLENGVKVVLLASLNDQVVPIYGASFSTASHPLLLRALFVDGASYSSSDFMIRLLNFAFMLRNAGLDDQRLVEHLSEATAGSLTGLGHSTPYEEPDSYALAVAYLFHSGPARTPLPPLSVEPFNARETRNDFELPWIMRALVDSEEVKDLFGAELAELKEGVVAWKPMTKVLKEVKKRLEPMAGRQSKLRHSMTSSTSGIPGEGVSEGGANGDAAKLAAAGLKRDW